MKGGAEKGLSSLLKIFFSTILKLTPLQIKNSPSGLRHLICGRFASLRIVTEKILIRAQSPLLQLLREEGKNFVQR